MEISTMNDKDTLVRAAELAGVDAYPCLDFNFETDPPTQMWVMWQSDDRGHWTEKWVPTDAQLQAAAVLKE